MESESETPKRKKDHIRIALTSNVVPDRFRNQFDQVTLIHEALPSVSIEEVDTSTYVFKKKIQAPIIVGARTWYGGWKSEVGAFG